jgi:hypothetical protein
VTPEQRLAIAADAIDAWGSAVRRDWSDFDGRQAREQIISISYFLRDTSDEEYDPLAGIVCRNGRYGPHWAYSEEGDHECE